MKENKTNESVMYKSSKQVHGCSIGKILFLKGIAITRAGEVKRIGK